MNKTNYMPEKEYKPTEEVEAKEGYELLLSTAL